MDVKIVFVDPGESMGYGYYEVRFERSGINPLSFKSTNKFKTLKEAADSARDLMEESEHFLEYIDSEKIVKVSPGVYELR